MTSGRLLLRVVDDPAVQHADDATRVAHHAPVVGGDHEGGLVAGVELDEQLHQLAGRLRVKVRRRLGGQH